MKKISKTVRLVSMKGEPQMKSGMIGIVEHIDDAGQLHVRWENGSGLALIPGEDKYEILDDSLAAVLDVVLQDDNTESGGTSFAGETVRDFLSDTEDNVTTLSELNDLLRECGILPIPYSDNCSTGTYNCDSCCDNGDCIYQGMDGHPVWEGFYPSERRV